MKWPKSSKEKVQSQRKLGKKRVSHRPPTSSLSNSSETLGVPRPPTKQGKKLDKAHFTWISNDRMAQLIPGTHTHIISAHFWKQRHKMLSSSPFCSWAKLQGASHACSQVAEPEFEPKALILLSHGHRILHTRCFSRPWTQRRKKSLLPYVLKDCPQDKLWNLIIYYEIKQRMKKTFHSSSTNRRALIAT